MEVRIHEGFMEIGRFDHVAVYSGLTDRQRNSRRTPVSTPRGRFLSRVLDYAQKARVGRRPARLVARPHSRLTLVISSKANGQHGMVHGKDVRRGTLKKRFFEFSDFFQNGSILAAQTSQMS